MRKQAKYLVDLLGRPGKVAPSRTQRGQSLVELALVTPLLLLLLVGIIEIGRFAYFSILVANAARAGAQYGAQSLATAADVPGITLAANNDTGVGGLTVTPTQICGCPGNALGTCPTNLPLACGNPNRTLVYVQVQVQGTLPSLFHYPGIPPSVSVTSTEQMRVAQ